jgi:cold-inducible RNA-binding protein
MFQPRAKHGSLRASQLLITHMNDTRLFIGNLSFNTTEEDLKACFAQAGAVSSVNLMMDKFTGKSRGFAFVEMASAAEAAKAIELFHGKPLHERALTVNIARPREERPLRESRGPRESRGESREQGGYGQRY